MDFLQPQLLVSAEHAPEGRGWIYEAKIDGYRAQVRFEGDRVRLFTRNGVDWTDRFPALLTPLRGSGQGVTTLDGELCALRHDGTSDFRLLCDRLGNQGNGLVFYPFDILTAQGTDLTSLPLSERKRRLSRVLSDLALQLTALPYSTSGARKLLQRERLRNGEGIVAKRADGPYRAGQRHPDWRKIKLLRLEEFVVCGWEPDESGSVKSLVLADYVGGALRYRGRVGTGFSVEARYSLAKTISESSVLESRPISSPRLPTTTLWVKPKVVVQIRAQGLQPTHVVRHPVFVGLREDKTPEEMALQSSQEAG